MNGIRQGVLVIGVGNELLGDEGLGVHVARALAAPPAGWPPEVKVLEAGTALLDFLPEMASYSWVILVDAVKTGRAPGTILRAELSRDLGGPLVWSHPLSLHEWGCMETLQAGRALGLLPARLTLLGAEPERIAPCLELSPKVAEAAQHIVAWLLEELDRRAIPSER